MAITLQELIRFINSKSVKISMTLTLQEDSAVVHGHERREAAEAALDRCPDVRIQRTV
jgi:hypothetical protein